MVRTPRSRRSLDRDAILRAAFVIADGADLSALTMRRLAADLGVGVMTLYGYYATKDDILDAMADEVLGGLHLPDLPDDATPHTVFTAVTRALAAALGEHPSVARILTMRVTDSPAALAGAMEAVLHRFAAAGMSGPVAVRAYGMMMTYCLGAVLYRIPRPWAPGDPGRGAFYRGLPADRFPQVRAYADLLPALPGDAQFEAGLTALADGVATLTRAGTG